MKNILYHILIGFLMVFLPGTIQAESPDSLVSKANQAYADSDFEQAISLYTAVIDSGYESAAVYYNLGNAYFKSNKTTRAILNFERAKLLEPTDKEIQYNLELVQTFVIDEIEPLPEFILLTWFKKLVNSMKVDTWAWVSLALFIAGLGLFMVFLFTRKFTLKKSGFILGIIAILLSVFAFSMAGIRKNWQENHNTAIIFEPNVTVKSAPDDSGTDLFVLHEGTKVKIMDQVGDWNEIVIASGNKGWLKAETLEAI